MSTHFQSILFSIDLFYGKQLTGNLGMMMRRAQTMRNNIAHRTLS
jgi:hypothetical protein